MLRSQIDLVPNPGGTPRREHNLGANRHPVSLGRRTLERLSRGIVLERELPHRVGGRKIWVSPEASSLRVWSRNTERAGRALFDLASDVVRQGDVVWDIGANVGFFTFSAAYLAGASGSVTAIEPDALSAGLLRKTAACAHVGSAPVQVVPVAVAETVKLSRFHIARRARSANFIEGFGATQADGSREVHVVPTVSLSWLAAELQSVPDVLKIDVEGAEHLALRGAEDLLRRARPRICIEVESENAGDVTEFLTRHRYRMFDADVSKAERKELRLAAWNTIALPE